MKVLQPITSMVTFQNKKTFPFDQQRFADKTISTLLVPAHLLEDLKKKTKEHGNSLVIYLRNLLWMYRTLTHLLEIDILGLWEILSELGLSNAVPTQNKLLLRVSLSLRRVSQDFARSYHVRV